MSDQPPRYQGWARTPGQPWKKIEGTLSDTKGGCHARLMELVELQGHREVKNEMWIGLEGQLPPVDNTYRDRMMRGQK